MTNGIINHILSKSFVDGPGNRAVIFMQGCNFHCLYCHNPFTINFCDACGVCVTVCPTQALKIQNGHVMWDASKCVECDTCIKTCPNFSSPRTKTCTPQELWDEIAPIAPFIAGISVSGGEPSLQIPFLAAFFELVKEKSDLTTLIETNGYAGAQAYLPLLPYLDMVVVDLKVYDPHNHLELTGKALEPVLASIQAFADAGKLYEIHQVIVPGFTEDEAQVQQTAQFLAALNPQPRLRLLRFRPHGTSGAALKWESPSEASMDKLVEIARANGLRHVERSL